MNWKGKNLMDKDKIPDKFNNEQEASDWWDKHSVADYLDEIKEVEFEVELNDNNDRKRTIDMTVSVHKEFTGYCAYHPDCYHSAENSSGEDWCGLYGDSLTREQAKPCSVFVRDNIDKCPEDECSEKICDYLYLYKRCEKCIKDFGE